MSKVEHLMPSPISVTLPGFFYALQTSAAFKRFSANFCHAFRQLELRAFVKSFFLFFYIFATVLTHRAKYGNIQVYLLVRLGTQVRSRSLAADCHQQPCAAGADRNNNLVTQKRADNLAGSLFSMLPNRSIVFLPLPTMATA